MKVAERLVPELRFPGCEGEWGKYDFGKIAKKSKTKYDPNKNDQEIPCLELECIEKESGILLKILSSKTQKSIKSVFKKNDVLFGKLRPNLKKYLLAPFGGVCSSEIWVLNGVKVINSFLHSIIQTNKFYRVSNITFGSKMPRADWEFISSYPFPIPTVPEQQKIASFLSAVDKKIEKLTRKKELLELYKKGVMQKIFSQEIRFKDDDGKDFSEWEEKRLGKVTTKVGKKNSEGYDYPVYSINNIIGFVPQGEQFEGVDSGNRGYDTKLYKIVSEKTFAYNPARINVGSIGYSYNLKNVIISSLYVCFQTNNQVDDLYLLQFLKTHRFNKAVLRNVEGGVRDYLFYNNFANIKLPLPFLGEQQRIVDFLSCIDKKIESIDNQLNKTQEFKKALLQKMFV